MPSRSELLLPELGLAERTITASVWLVAEGATVSEGDRILEVVSDGVTIDLPAPAAGVLAEQTVAEGESLRVGQVLGVIQAADAEQS